MKIYTKKGDDGTTSLYGGKRVVKHAGRIETFGSVDELNAILGVGLTYVESREVANCIREIQHQLFVLGADIATPPDSEARIDRIAEHHIERLESMIDKLDETLEPLKHFILPGGSRAGATLHQARTVCRRAERMLVSCRLEESLSIQTLIYLNRLSDLLFVLARVENRESNVTETPWKPERRHSETKNRD